MRTNATIVIAWSVFLVAFASGCGIGSAQAGGGGDENRARLEIKGQPGGEFSGSCAIGDEEPKEFGGEVPESFTYDLGGRSLECGISSEDDLRVEFSVGDNVRSAQSISGGTLNLTYRDGSVSSTTSSSSTSGGEESSSSSQVTSSAEKDDQGRSGETNGSANVASESRDVGGFDEVELRGLGNLSIEQTGGESLTVEAEERVLPKLTTEVVNGRLIIGPKPGSTVRTNEQINYELTVENLNALEVSGSGDVEAEGIETDRLAVTVGGAGDVKAGGEADEQEVDISGSGVYRAEGLKSREAKVSVSGAGSAIVNASEELDAEVGGAGSVEYVGDPKVEQDVSAAGRVSER
jgi:hypothetical protein